jgi:hypothetical protein
MPHSCCQSSSSMMRRRLYGVIFNEGLEVAVIPWGVEIVLLRLGVDLIIGMCCRNLFYVYNPHSGSSHSLGIINEPALPASAVEKVCNREY